MVFDDNFFGEVKIHVVDSNVKSDPQKLEPVVYFEHVADEVDPHLVGDHVAIGEVCAVDLGAKLPPKQVFPDVCLVEVNDLLLCRLVLGKQLRKFLMLAYGLPVALAKRIYRGLERLAGGFAGRLAVDRGGGLGGGDWGLPATSLSPGRNHFRKLLLEVGEGEGEFVFMIVEQRF